MVYTLCTRCDHFVDANDGPPGVSPFIHLENGEQEFDHDAEPGESRTLDEWRSVRPDLFALHADGMIGPNSAHHCRRGKLS